MTYKKYRRRPRSIDSARSSESTALETELPDDSVPIFCSSNMDELERAAELLQESQIPFSVEYTNEGSLKMPQSVSRLKVPGQYEEDALRAVADVPSEIMLPPLYTPGVTSSDRINARLTMIVLAFILVFGVIMVVLDL